MGISKSMQALLLVHIQHSFEVLVHEELVTFQQ